jgi:hypothetical protein
VRRAAGRSVAVQGQSGPVVLVKTPPLLPRPRPAPSLDMCEWELTVGCALLGMGPQASVFFVLVVKRAQLIVVAALSAWAWLLSSLLSSILAIGIANPLGGGWVAAAVIGSAAQEWCRVLLVRFYCSGEAAIARRILSRPQQSYSGSDGPLPLNDLTSAIGGCWDDCSRHRVLALVSHVGAVFCCLHN